LTAIFDDIILLLELLQNGTRISRHKNQQARESAGTRISRHENQQAQESAGTRISRHKNQQARPTI